MPEERATAAHPGCSVCLGSGPAEGDACGGHLGSAWRGELADGDASGIDGGEVGDHAPGYAPGHMLYQLRRYGHLAAYQFSEVGVAHGVREIVGLGACDGSGAADG